MPLHRLSAPSSLSPAARMNEVAASLVYWDWDNTNFRFTPDVANTGWPADLALKTINTADEYWYFQRPLGTNLGQLTAGWNGSYPHWIIDEPNYLAIVKTQGPTASYCFTIMKYTKDTADAQADGHVITPWSVGTGFSSTAMGYSYKGSTGGFMGAGGIWNGAIKETNTSNPAQMESPSGQRILMPGYVYDATGYRGTTVDGVRIIAKTQGAVATSNTGLLFKTDAGTRSWMQAEFVGVNLGMTQIALAFEYTGGIGYDA